MLIKRWNGTINKSWFLSHCLGELNMETEFIGSEMKWVL